VKPFPVYVPLAWHDHAACVGVKDVNWFPQSDKPGGRSAAHLANVARAKAICAECPVKAECLEAALMEPMTYGIWGGTTAAERRGRAMPLRVRPAKCGTDSGYSRHRNRHETPCDECRAAHAIAGRVRKYTRAVLDD
jgi:WhiB family redox-sensing transcriptional regulator